LEQWYFGLLKDGRVPGALVNNNPLSKRISRPNTAYTKSLTADARERFPRLRWELSDSMLEDFVTDEGWLKATKYRDSKREVSRQQAQRLDLRTPDREPQGLGPALRSPAVERLKGLG